MAQFTSLLKKPWQVSMSGQAYAELHNHLFPGDADEHGAVILAGLAESERNIRLLVREIHLARDGKDFVPSKRGYRRLCGEFVTEHIIRARNERLVYLAAHSHGGTNQVAFSSVDLHSHERGYPALLDVTREQPVGALVFAKNAVAGDIWLSRHTRVPIERAIIVGATRQYLAPAPAKDDNNIPYYFDRQVRLFGEVGQSVLQKAKVAVMGVGGAGSILAELIARLGVGHIVLVDSERAEPNNIPRLIGSTWADAAAWFTNPTRPRWIQAIGRKFARLKVDLAQRNIRRASPETKIETYAIDCCHSEIAATLKDCDYLFLAADTMRARLLFNALVHQYLIPGVQVGAKVLSDKNSGVVTDVYAVTRPVTPDHGCLLCNQLINPSKLQEESSSEQERQNQRYVDDEDIVAPSVVTLNALTAAQAANDFLFYMTGLMSEQANQGYQLFQPTKRDVSWDDPRRDPQCLHCGTSSRSCRARGDGAELPTVSS